MGVNKRLVQMNNLPLNPTWFTQVQILLHRTFQEQFRQSRIIITSFIQTVIIGILIGTVYLKIGTGQKSIVRREPSLFFCAVNQGVFGALMVINSFPVERTLTLRERASGTYFASAYFTAKIIAETLVQIPVPIIFVCIGLKYKLVNIFCSYSLVMYCILSNWLSSNSWQIFSFYAFYVIMFSCSNIISIVSFCYL
jgi:hypothetical protein